MSGSSGPIHDESRDGAAFQSFSVGRHTGGDLIHALEFGKASQSHSSFPCCAVKLWAMVSRVASVFLSAERSMGCALYYIGQIAATDGTLRTPSRHTVYGVWCSMVRDNCLVLPAHHGGPQAHASVRYVLSPLRPLRTGYRCRRTLRNTYDNSPARHITWKTHTTVP